MAQCYYIRARWKGDYYVHTCELTGTSCFLNGGLECPVFDGLKKLKPEEVQEEMESVK